MSGASAGWQGALLRVDLSSNVLEPLEVETDLAHGYMGGRGFATRLAWEMLKPGMDPFSPETPLFVMTGPLTGTMAPFSGRTTVCGLAPQGYPVPWFTRSSFGGHWGPSLKYAGYDGLILHGCSEELVALVIDDGRADLVRAEHLRGMGIYSTQQILARELGGGYSIIAAGPAAENSVRISVMATETESASGQGGLGAVMASKNLKAIAVRGSKPISLARPDEFAEFCSLVASEAHGSHGWPREKPLIPELVARYRQRYHACTQQCQLRCWDCRFYSDVPGVVEKEKRYSGQVDCVAQLFPGPPNTRYDWDLGFEAGFEVGRLANDLGLNHWEILIGMVPWLRRCREEGLVEELDGITLDFSRPATWHELLRRIAYREGVGEALSEGGVRASRKLGLGEELMREFYPAWGYAAHWDGHGDMINHIFFPYWLVSAVLWATDTRDPISSTHGYVQNVMGWSTVCSPEHGLTWERISEIGEKVYGSPLAFDPLSGYDCKAYPALWHQHRSVLKDSLTVGDQVYPRVFSLHTPDNFARVEYRGKKIPGPEFEYWMYAYATGHEPGLTAFERTCERVVNLDRLIQIRMFGRDREDDEGVVDYFATPETRTSPLIGEPVSMDEAAFAGVMDEYYAMRGWDTASGRPTPEKIRELDLPPAGELSEEELGS